MGRPASGIVTKAKCVEGIQLRPLRGKNGWKAGLEKVSYYRTHKKFDYITYLKMATQAGAFCSHARGPGPTGFSKKDPDLMKSIILSWG